MAPGPLDEGDVTLSVEGGLDIEIVTDTTAGLPLEGTVSMVIVPEWLPGSSVVVLAVTVNVRTERPEAGVTENQPCGLDAATTFMVSPFIEAGRVTVKGVLVDLSEPGVFAV